MFAAEGSCRSFIVIRPGGALMTLGIILISIAIVQESPFTHGLDLKETFGTPSMST